MKDKRVKRKESKKCTRCKPSGLCKMECADLTILYSNDAAEWNNYLMRCFQELQCSRSEEEEELHVRQQCLENLVMPLTIAKIGFFRRAKSQIVILSPDFLEFVVNNPNVILGKLFEPSRVIALLCGVSESEVTSLHRASLVGFDSWRKMTVLEKDQDFVMRLINTALEIIQSNSKCSSEQPLQQASTVFVLNPKKAKEGSAKVTVEFHKPMSKDDVISVFIETEKESVPVSIKCTNPYNVRFTIPVQFFGVSQYVQIHVKCGNESLGVRPLKCESKMGELNHLLLTILNPMNFMCQTLGLSSNSVEELDRVLVESFTKNVPRSGFSLFDFNKDECKRKVPEEVPTLLHFAAKMGLRELCTALLDCPGAAAVCQIRNAQGLNPADMAETEGHSCLANMLENFTRLSETAEMYTYMKSMTESGSNVDYENLRLSFRQNIGVGELSLQFDEAFGMTPQTHVMLSYKPDDEQQQPTATSIGIEQEFTLEEIKTSNEEVFKNNVRFYSQSQQELLQLLEDFKQDKYTIAEVELLFNNWQLRQKCHSFKEKQEALRNMRQHYDHIQKKCQQEGKKSALEKFRTFLVRNVKKEFNPVVGKANAVHIRPKNVDESGDALPSAVIGVRPFSNSSSSSRSSSSLSNRSSTLSGLSVCSATDSGAQSDIGEEHGVGDSSSTLHLGSQKLHSSPLVSRMIENLQYMYTPVTNPSIPSNTNSNLRPFSKRDVPTVKNNGNYGTRPSRVTLRDRNPMPFPRLLPSFVSRVSSSPVSEEQQSLDYITPDEHNDSGDYSLLGFLPPPPPVPNANVAPHSDTRQSDQEVTCHVTPPKDEYLFMENKSPRPPSSNGLVPITSEPDYCNVSYKSLGIYMDMSSPNKGTTSLEVPSIPSRTHITPLGSSPVYMNTTLKDCGDFDPDRCDSVPDFPPPAPPTPNCRRKIPPPLPPRNPGLPRAK